MKHLTEFIGGLLFMLTWIAGIVLAKGFWSTAAAIFLPPWSWYLLIEHGMRLAGWIS